MSSQEGAGSMMKAMARKDDRENIRIAAEKHIGRISG